MSKRTIELREDKGGGRRVVVGVVGLCLVVHCPRGSQLVPAHHCVDQAEFWQVFHAINPHRLVWEDGTTFSE